MRRGFTLAELVVVILITGMLGLAALPSLKSVLDRVAVERAASEVTMTLAAARHMAISFGVRTRVTIRADSLAVDSLGREGWGRWRAFPGPQTLGVSLAVSNPVVQYNGIGIGWGLSNTRVVLGRGSHSETITTSRLGRVKRW